MTNNAFLYASERPIDLICMGRVAVDLYAEQIGSALAEATSFRKYLGGCAGNIAVGAARLGLQTLMFSCVGKDEMGSFIKKTLAQEKVKTDLLYETEQHLTGLVLLGIKPPKDFPLIFYRNNCADMQLKPEQAKIEIIKQAKALLITGTGLSTEAMLATTMHVLELAKKLETKIIFDLDFRPVLWGLTAIGNGETRYLPSTHVSEIYQRILPYCDLIVGTEEEISIASGVEDQNQALEIIYSHSKAPVVVKLGERGCQVHFQKEARPFQSKSFPVEVLNILGAGDGFMAGLLRGLLSGSDWQTATSYANACGALVVTRHGCSTAIPYWNELNYFMQEYEYNPLVWKSQYLAQLHQQNTRASPQMLIKNPLGFKDGINAIVKMDEAQPNTLMNFYSLKLRQGECFSFNKQFEFAALLMTGRVHFHYEKKTVRAERSDYFSQTPYVLHCPSGTEASVEALTDCELMLIETENERYFLPLFFDQQNSVELDHRGKGLLENTSYRLVRTVFDKRNRPESNLVLGEIISLQGHWSSYPSHYHAQPEIYHYRFSEPQGYAFGENGPEVLRIEHNDTYQITEGQTHAHCTAPGYALYTLWFIRHTDNPYLIPTFEPQHEWTRELSANKRVWQLREPCEE